MSKIRSGYYDQRRKQESVEGCRPGWTEVPKDGEITKGIGGFDEGIP
jgi:hypothetical protein